MATICAVVATMVAGCASAPAPPPTPSSSAVPLSQPGAADGAIAQLVSAAGTNLAIRVAITQQTASLTYVSDDEAVTLGWQDGAVSPEDSDVTYVGQTVFAVSSFDLSDVGLMFAQAAALTGSSANQQLQINEYNTGRVLMTVTTSPESQTIFFRSDATIINWLSFTMTDGMAEALRDVATGGDVIALGLNDQGFYADIRVDSATIERVVRPAKLPAYSALRSATSNLTAFNPNVVSAAILAGLLTQAPILAGKPDATATMVIDNRDNLGQPAIRVSVGLSTRVYNLAGVDITSQVS